MKDTKMRVAAGLSLLFLGAVAWPVRLNWIRKPQDSFPLSYYPMFSHDRRGKAEVTYLLGVSAAGQRQYLPYQLVGTGGMNQVRKVIAKRAIRNPNALCRDVASAVAAGRQGVHNIRTVKIIRSTFLFKQFYAGDQTPAQSLVLCSCATKRDAVAKR